jgi:hypothetical protein
MKLERMMKKYYSGKVDSIDLPEMTGFPARARRVTVPRTRPVFDTVLNCAVHAAIALLVVLGLPGLRETSLLSARITRIAEDVSLDKRIESQLKLLSENIIKIRNTR